MTGVPDKAVESVRSDCGAIFGCGWRSYAKVGHLVGRPHFGKSGQSARAVTFCVVLTNFSDESQDNNQHLEVSTHF